MFKTLFKLMIICTSLLINGCGGDDDNISTENEEITKEPEYLGEVITDTTINTTRLFWLYFHHEEIPDALIETEAPRRDLIVMNAWFHEYIVKFKAQNPDIKALVYKDLSSTRSYAVENGVDSQYLPTGVGFQYAEDNNPEWFLVDENDNRLEYTGYPEHWQMDVGNSEYQEMWADQVANELVVNGWDGVMMDNALFYLDTYHEDVFPKNYTSNEEFQTAYKLMLAKINDRLKINDKLGLANITNTRLQQGLWNEYMENLDGGLDEWWLVFGDGSYLPDYAEGMIAQINEVVSNEEVEKITLVQPHSSTSDQQGFYYAFASYWLVNNGNTYFSEQEVTDAYKDPSPWREEYTWNLGSANDTFYKDENGIYRRDFSRAIVLVNANENDSQQIELDYPHLNEKGEKVTSIILKGMSGSVLRKIIVE